MALAAAVLRAIPNYRESNPTLSDTCIKRTHDEDWFDSDFCPGFFLLRDTPGGDVGHVLGCRIQVLNIDSFDAAEALNQESETSDPPVCVLNFANAYTVGGGFLSDAMMQEEFLCFRSTLYPALKSNEDLYPLDGNSALYSPRIGIIAESYKPRRTTKFYPEDSIVPVVAVITAAAEMLSGKICKLSKDRTHYKDPECAEYMRRQLRLVLRMAKDYGHTKVVLGAIGCGAFSHPNREVAKLWLAVFMEEEFKGGWWENVVFAVKDPVNSTMGDGNYAVFFQTLHGVVV